MSTASVKDKLMTFFRKNAVPLVAGCIALAVLLIAGTSLNSDESAAEPQQLNISYDEREYVKRQEQKLKELLSDIDGVGECEVMIVTDSGYEYVYAEDRTSSDGSSSSSYKILDSSDGDSALLLKLSVPKVTGVAVVCQGGESASVKEQITELVGKTFNLSGSSISVAKMR